MRIRALGMCCNCSILYARLTLSIAISSLEQKCCGKQSKRTHCVLCTHFGWISCAACTCVCASTYLYVCRERRCEYMRKMSKVCFGCVYIASCSLRWNSNSAIRFHSAPDFVKSAHYFVGTNQMIYRKIHVFI